MDRVRAIAELPERYGIAIRLRDAGVADAVIVEALGIELEARRSFFLLAAAKLERIMADEATPAPSLGGHGRATTAG